MASAAPSNAPSKKRKTSPVQRETSSIDPTLLGDSVAAAQDALRSLSASRATGKLDAPSYYAPYPSPRAPTTRRAHIDLDYVTRSTPADSLPLISHRDETILGAYRLLQYYQNVFDRDESLACNFGVKTLRCELIETWASRNLSPSPAILQKPHPTEPDPQWPAIVHAYLRRPDAIISKLEPRGPSHNGPASSEGASTQHDQVAQLWLDDTLVSMSASDFRKLERALERGALSHLPSKPIDEDERREVASLNILEQELREVQRWADEVAALSRQVNWRIGKRRRAIDDRRLAEGIHPFVSLDHEITSLLDVIQRDCDDQPKPKPKIVNSAVDCRQPIAVSQGLYDDVYDKISASALSRAKLHGGGGTAEIAVRDGLSESPTDGAGICTE